MSIATLILGQSGTGKSTSLRNLDPRNVLLIQVIKKPLPFRSPNWKYITPENKQGSILVSDNPQIIINVINGSKRPIKIISIHPNLLISATNILLEHSLGLVFLAKT